MSKDLKRDLINLELLAFGIDKGVSNDYPLSVSYDSDTDHHSNVIREGEDWSNSWSDVEWLDCQATLPEGMFYITIIEGCVTSTHFFPTA